MTAEARIGHRYDPVEYAVTREAIDDYVAAVGEDPTVWGEIAPPMFAVVYQSPAVSAGLFDPELAIDFAHLVHGSQQFAWPGPVVRDGDRLSTTAEVSEIRQTAGLTFYGFSTRTVNLREETVCTGVWTNIVRGEA